MILPQTDLENCRAVAERLRQAATTMKITSNEGRTLPTITISLGVALLKDGAAAATLVSRTDAALYTAKEAGRNRVMAAK
ncbi:MAG: diguanylate cyclase [Magnetococcales bacterium]|nr:diguanylate cyclase [Magnetococcales bacterium]